MLNKSVGGVSSRSSGDRRQETPRQETPRRETGVSIQESVFRSQYSGVRRLFLFIIPTPHTPHPTPHTPINAVLTYDWLGT
ncbi:MAG: hypothetical protein EWV83_00410 [Microcystis sp. M_OC_Ca_00000000_S217Cul]|nr:MAG: hypothetical protein EWV83_00410 [Microcystis sp. M_OC_Ca_00000000_S217Cul]TRT86799.1 MAG: hypothetical protein EWV66_15475 [Microcystis sp. M_OC_Ca_00000000_C217Col]